MSSNDTLSVKSMRWVARLIAIPWSFWVLFWIAFIAGYGVEEGKFTWAVWRIIVFIFALPSVGAAIMGCIRKTEALAGIILLVDGVLILVFGTLGPHSPLMTGDLWGTVLGFTTLVLPPLVAGVLFIVCRSESKT